LKQEAFHRKHIFFELTTLVHYYSEAKEFLGRGYYLDSLHRVHQSLHHMGRLTVLQAGEQPATLLWRQVRSIDSSVYKLYEELSTSEEPLDKRIELFLLALDFSILSKFEMAVEFLVEILKNRKEGWTIEEILMELSVHEWSFEIISILDKMEKRSLI